MTLIGGILLRFARWVAGRERAEWMDAMAAETEAADGNRLYWAAGCLWAAAVDRMARDRLFVAGMIAIPAVSFVIVLTLGFLLALGGRKFGWSPGVLVPVMLFGPLPFAWLLGKLRPSSSAPLVGTAGFLVHQSVPLLAMWILFGISPTSFWAVNLTYYNLPPVAGLTASWLVWVAGVRLGHGKLGKLRNV
jgi:hypothetical protein